MTIFLSRLLSRRAIAAAGAVLMCAGVVPVASASKASAQTAGLDVARVPARTQITLRLDNAAQWGTPNAGEPRPALSLAKLYLGYWVLTRGEEGDKARVEEMIQYSHDGHASYLDAKYPQAIDEVAGQLRLTATRRNGYWGNSTTSTNDLVTFLAAVRQDPAAAPIVRGMDNAAPVAADGYRQDFGTAALPGVWGTKFSWDDSHVGNHATASYGNGFIIAANTFGTAGDLTADVLIGVHIADAPAPGVPTLPGGIAPRRSQLEKQILGVLPPQLHGFVAPTLAQASAALCQVGSSTAC